MKREEILARIPFVPSLPSVAIDVMCVAQDPDMTLNELSKVIEQSPSLTANLLKLANSAFFGIPRTISSVPEAIKRLGTKKIVQLVISDAVTRSAGQEVRGYDLPPLELWKHALATSLATEVFAQILDQKLPGEGTTAALLIDLGKIILGEFVEIDATPIRTLAHQQNIPFDQAENEILGIDHAEVGALLLEHWNIPESIVEIVRWHHQPEKVTENSLGVDLVHLADSLCALNGIGTGADGSHYHPSDTVLTRYKITPSLLEKATDKILNQFEMACDTFSPEKGESL